MPPHLCVGKGGGTEIFMIKIIHVITDTNIGGAGRVLVQFLKCYDRSTFEVSVCIPENAELIPLIKNEGVRIIELHHGRDKSFDKAAVSELRQIFKREKPDIVHTHSAFSARIAAFLSGVKSRIYTRHCTFDMPKKLTTFPGKQLNGFINNMLATQIIAVAYSAAENLTDTGVSEKKITVIMNGVEKLRETSEEERRALKAELGIKEDDFVCGISARLEHYKGHMYLLDTASSVVKKHDNVKFIIMGAGSEEEKLKKRTEELGITDKVIFTGLVSDVAAYYNIMDVQLNCSYGTEATSISLCEGMSIGLPAVVTTFGGNPYMITDGVNGKTVPPKDSEKMGEELTELIENPEELDGLRRGALEEYEKKFTASSMTSQMEEIYRKEAERIGAK